MDVDEPVPVLPPRTAATSRGTAEPDVPPAVPTAPAVPAVPAVTTITAPSTASTPATTYAVGGSALVQDLNAMDTIAAYHSS